MATSPNNSNRLFDGGIKFIPGVNSDIHPSLLKETGETSWAVNMVNKGGVWSLRPGYENGLRYPDGKAQGFTIFTPVGGLPQHVVAVSGKIYVSNFPFTIYSQLPSIQFDPFADQIIFKEALQSANLGVQIAPKPVLIMQDGKTKAAYTDGSVSRHLNGGGNTKETPIGFYMEWIGSRLWVMRGNEIFAGDIDDPLHFTETTYLAGGGSFQPMDGKNGTGLARTADNKSLLVFTLENTTVIQAGITNRSTWNTTPGFISILFPGVGSVSGKSFCYNNGELWWFSKEGVRRFAQVGATIQVSKNAISSQEMRRSFENLSPVLNRVCAFSFGTYIGFSVPSGDIYNRHTWIIDVSPESSLSGSASPAWQGIWQGTRPVEWATATINGKDRCFYLSQDRDGGVRVWEAFQSEATDNGFPIYWSNEGQGLTFGELLSFKQFKYTEIHLTGVLGPVHFWVEYKGDYGCWKKILDINICAQRCAELTCGSQNTDPSSQNRFYKTQEGKHACESGIGPYSDDIGTYFQNRFRGQGTAGFRAYRSSAIQYPESSTGECSRGDINKTTGLLDCKSLLCCDMEVDYISPPIDSHYGYPSSSEVSASI